MKIGVISDTHGDLRAWQRALSLMSGAELIIHAGDVLYHGPRNPIPEGYDPAGLALSLNQVGSLIIVRGNCDADVDQLVIDVPIMSPYAFIFVEGLRIIVHHGVEWEQKSKEDLARRYKANLLISGHTHRGSLDATHNAVFLNPGSPSLPKEPAPASIALIENGTVKLVSLSGEVLKQVSLTAF